MSPEALQLDVKSGHRVEKDYNDIFFPFVSFQEILLYIFKGKCNIKRQLAWNKGKNSFFFFLLKRLIKEWIWLYSIRS